MTHGTLEDLPFIKLEPLQLCCHRLFLMGLVGIQRFALPSLSIDKCLFLYDGPLFLPQFVNFKVRNYSAKHDAGLT